MALAGLAAAQCGPVRAAGEMDPTYRDVLAAPERAVGRLVDWRLRLLAVEKRFYTYTLIGEYLPDPGEGPCGDCKVSVLFRARPEENVRPGRFQPRQIVAVRGTVLRLAPRLAVLASAIEVR